MKPEDAGGCGTCKHWERWDDDGDPATGCCLLSPAADPDIMREDDTCPDWESRDSRADRLVKRMDGKRFGTEEGSAMMVCSTCGAEKPESGFYNGTGQCKACQNKRAQEYQRSDRGRAWRSEWRKTPAGRAYFRAKQSRYYARHAHKVRAGSTLRYHIRQGLLERPSFCSQCGAPQHFNLGQSYLEAHHHDYTKPLDVRWLCGPCHKLEHAWSGAKRAGRREK